MSTRPASDTAALSAATDERIASISKPSKKIKIINKTESMTMKSANGSQYTAPLATGLKLTAVLLTHHVE